MRQGDRATWIWARGKTLAQELEARADAIAREMYMSRYWDGRHNTL